MLSMLLQLFPCGTKMVWNNATFQGIINTNVYLEEILNLCRIVYQIAPGTICIYSHRQTSVEEIGSSYDGAMSRWLMLKPEADTPPREEEMVRNVTAKV